MIAPLSPILAPDLVCNQCSSVMRRVIVKQSKNGKLDRINYYCDGERCKYGVTLSSQHSQTQSTPYSPPEKEVLSDLVKPGPLQEKKVAAEVPAAK